MLTLKPIIVFIMLFVLSHCDDYPDLGWPDYGIPLTPPPDFGSPEEFVKEVNEFRAKFAKEHRIPNMYKLVWSNELVGELNGSSGTTKLKEDFRRFHISSYRNSTELINAEIGRFKNQSDLYLNLDKLRAPIELINTLQTFIGCDSELAPNNSWFLKCLMRFGRRLNFWYADPGEAGSQCPPRFKGEDGLCVPVDPSKHTILGTEVQLLEDVNYMRRKYAKKFGIPCMHQLTWNESHVETIKSLDWNFDESSYLGYNFKSAWKMVELVTFSAAVTAIEEAVYSELVLNDIYFPIAINGELGIDTALQLLHPLQTSIGCMKIKRTDESDTKFTTTMCSLGDMKDYWDFRQNKKIPGSECMDGYVNDDGLCVVAPPTTTPQPTTTKPVVPTTVKPTPKPTPKTTPKEAVPTIPTKPLVASDDKEKEGVSVKENASLEPEQEALESSVTTRNYSYGLWILMFILLLF